MGTVWVLIFDVGVGLFGGGVRGDGKYGGGVDGVFLEIPMNRDWELGTR